MVEEETSHEENAGYETRDVDLRTVAVWASLTIVALILSIVFVWDFYVGQREAIVERVVLSPQSAELRELRAREAEELGTYKRLDSAAGQYRIPIERAMELVAAEAYRRQVEEGSAK